MSLEYANEPVNQIDGYSELKNSHDELCETVEQFRQANDERLNAIQKKQADDVLMNEKLERLDRAVRRLSNSGYRPDLAYGQQGSAELDPAVHMESKAALTSYVRSGDSSLLESVEYKSLSTNHDGDGGFLVPDYMEAQLDAKLAENSAMRQLANVIDVAQGSHLNFVSPNGEFAASWVGENAERVSSDTPNFQEIRINFYEIFANPAASQRFLEDAAVDVENWIVQSLAQKFAKTENEAFIVGTGYDSPKGILKYPMHISGTASPTGSIAAMKSGLANALPSNPLDFLIDFTTNLPSQYRSNAVWLMNASTLASLRRLKDNEGRYIWQPSLVLGQPSSLLGFPVYEEGFMQDIGSGKFPIAFGDMKAGYTIVRRKGMSVLRDPYSAKPFVSFYTTRRLGAAVVDFDAFQLVKIAA